MITLGLTFWLWFTLIVTAGAAVTALLALGVGSLPEHPRHRRHLTGPPDLERIENPDAHLTHR